MSQTTSAVDSIQRLHQHRAWANAKLLSAAEGLDMERLQKQFPIGQGSIWKSLLHLYAAEFVWLEAVSGNEAAIAPGDVPGKLPGNQEAPGGIVTLDELKARWSQLDARWAAYLGSLNPQALDEMIGRVSSATGKRMQIRRSDALLHVCTHAHYTAAQVVNMLRHAGVEPLPDISLTALARG